MIPLSRAVKLLYKRAMFAASESQSIVGYLSVICALWIAGLPDYSLLLISYSFVCGETLREYLSGKRSVSH